MADNDRTENTLSDIEQHTQLSDAQANRTWWTPGKSALSDNPANNLDESWPVEFVVKTGNPVFDTSTGIGHNRVTKEGRGTVCDQTIPVPNVIGTTSITADTGITGVYTQTETTTQDNNGQQERTTGWENLRS